jgi:hypothetical protein
MRRISLVGIDPLLLVFGIVIPLDITTLYGTVSSVVMGVARRQQLSTYRKCELALSCTRLTMALSTANASAGL